MTAAPSTSHNPAVTAVRGFYAALGSGDILAALARLGDTVSWHEAPGMPYQGPEPYHGAQQVAKHVLAPLTADVDGSGRLAGGACPDNRRMITWAAAQPGRISMLSQVRSADSSPFRAMGRWAPPSPKAG